MGRARREWSASCPTSLTITVIERLPVAWVRRPVPAGSPEGTLGAIVLVDRSGRVLGDEAQPPVGLPELIGVTRVPDRGDRIVPAAPARAVAELPGRAAVADGDRCAGGGARRCSSCAAPPGGARARGGGGAARQPRGDRRRRARPRSRCSTSCSPTASEVGYIDVRVPGAPATGD